MLDFIMVLWVPPTPPVASVLMVIWVLPSLPPVACGVLQGGAGAWLVLSACEC